MQIPSHVIRLSTPWRWFLQGASCWRGPARSLTLHLECGQQTELLAVEEPDRCVYEAVMRTPAVCDSAALEAAQAEVDQLLGTDGIDNAKEL
jgi:Glucosidase II beta subunit-like protein